MTLPPWIQAADPARYMEAGLRIADAEASEANSAAAQAASGQRAGQELQLRQQQLEQEATAAAQKFQAQQGYQQALAAGGDPIQAILKFGPLMGQGTDTAAAIRAQPKPPVPAPTITMQPGPNGTQIPLLVQGGRASVVPRAAYAAPAAPEQWKPAVRQIDGQDVPGQESTKSGRFIPFPGQQPGHITQQQRLQVGMMQKKKAALEKVIGDPLQTGAMARKRNGGKAPTHKDLEAVENDLQGQIDELDRQLETVGGNVPHGTSDTDNEPETAKAGNDPLGLFK
jgi:hypothetical protein